MIRLRNTAWTGIFFVLMFLWATLFPAVAQETKPLSLEEALTGALKTDPGIRSSSFDLLASQARSKDAVYRMIPSLAVSTGYTQLSQEPTASPVSTGNTTYDMIVNGLLKEFSGSPNNSRDVRLDLQYPIFAGFRLREAAELAKVQALSKADALELTQRALVFEIKRAYWEAVRATANVNSLSKTLELENLTKEEIRNLADQGMATAADQLAQDSRSDQALLSLDEAKAQQAMAFLALSSLIGDRTADSTQNSTSYTLTTAPLSSEAPQLKQGNLNEDQLVAQALSHRPEVRLAGTALNGALHAQKMAQADYYPTVLLTGAISYQDPDPRMFPPQDKFNLTWSAGVRLRYDIGGVPGSVERNKAADADAEKARSDLERQRNGIALDVRRCTLALNRARLSLNLTKGLVAQSEENLRVTTAKYDNGMVKKSDLLQAQIALLRSNFAVQNKMIDVEIAQADLIRATALEPVSQELQ